ncbi:MAG: hypothetical protein AAB486_01875 [Patescibacteria group bacterium]
METLEELAKRLTAVEDRNKRVETDKAWETSLPRRALLIIFTYVSIGLYFSAIAVDRPWINAVVPSLGFLLSTLTLPLFRNFWEKYFRR